MYTLTKYNLCLPLLNIEMKHCYFSFFMNSLNPPHSHINQFEPRVAIYTKFSYDLDLYIRMRGNFLQSKAIANT